MINRILDFIFQINLKLIIYTLALFRKIIYDRIAPHARPPKWAALSIFG